MLNNKTKTIMENLLLFIQEELNKPNSNKAKAAIFLYKTLEDTENSVSLLRAKEIVESIYDSIDFWRDEEELPYKYLDKEQKPPTSFFS